MADFFTSTGLGIGLVLVGQVLLVVVPLLVALAFLMYADRKIWAAVQMRRGPTWWASMACCNRWRTR